MKIELRRIKIYRGMSHETTAFGADLYLDGVKCGVVENDGRGGPNCFSERDAYMRVQAWAKTQPPLPCSWDKPIEMDADLWISLEVGRIEERRVAARLAKRVAKNRRNAVHAFIVVGETPDRKHIEAMPRETPDMPEGYRMIQAFTAAGAPVE